MAQHTHSTAFVVGALLAVSAAFASAQTLKRGARGSAVTQAQRALVLHGARISIDGVYGPRTAAAVKRFQQSRGLPATGRVDDITQRSLTRPVRRGDRGAAVRQLQRQLNRNGAGLKVDGKFGPKTEGALRNFQRAMGVSQSGTLDKGTLSKLISSSRRTNGQSQGAGKGGVARAALITRAKRYLANNPSGFRKDIFVIVDFTKPSSKKRLFIVDARSSRVLAAWKTAHGKGSDPRHTGRAHRFSNRPRSNMSSLGFFRTAETYYGKHGYSLRIDGLEDINNRARARAIVIHGARYIREGGISGRSLGCFSLDKRYSTRIIKQIKGGVLLYAYGGQK